VPVRGRWSYHRTSASSFSFCSGRPKARGPSPKPCVQLALESEIAARPCAHAMSVRKEKGRCNSKDRTAETAGDFTSDGSGARPCCACARCTCAGVKALLQMKSTAIFIFSCFVATYCGRPGPGGWGRPGPPPSRQQPQM
jgi:hypothetical protein